MNTNLNLPNYIIVLGTTYSGCTAVYDYFNGRGDLYAPLIGEEYLLPQIPFGLMSLEASAGNAFNSSSAEFALSKFEDIAEKLTRPKTFWFNGKGKLYVIPGLIYLLFRNQLNQRNARNVLVNILICKKARFIFN